jgi:hypothetical protein
MVKLGLLATVFATIAALGLATLSSSPARADGDKNAPCVRTDFKTELVKAACTNGTKNNPKGQEAAKEVMKAFNKDHSIKSCNDCHSSLSPKYDLKDTGLKHFQDLGGK